MTAESYRKLIKKHHTIMREIKFNLIKNSIPRIKFFGDEMFWQFQYALEVPQITKIQKFIFRKKSTRRANLFQERVQYTTPALLLSTGHVLSINLTIWRPLKTG